MYFRSLIVKLMKKIELKSRKLLRTLFGCLSFTAIAFVFQACYGIEPPYYYDVKFTGMVKSKTTKKPIRGIKITVNEGEPFFHNDNDYGITDENGIFSFFANIPSRDYYYGEMDSLVFFNPDSVRISFSDIDSTENGEFSNKTIIINPAYKNEVKLFVELEDKY